MKDAAGEDAIKFMLVEDILRAEGKVVKVQIQNGLQNENTHTKSNDKAIGQGN